MRVLSWPLKRARLLQSLAPLDSGAEARGRRLQEALAKGDEERLLREAQKAIEAAPLPEPEPEPEFEEFLPTDALPPAAPPDEPPPLFLSGDLPDADLPPDISAASESPAPPARKAAVIYDDLPPVDLPD